jgi:hypothetical protein
VWPVAAGLLGRGRDRLGGDEAGRRAAPDPTLADRRRPAEQAEGDAEDDEEREDEDLGGRGRADRGALGVAELFQLDPIGGREVGPIGEQVRISVAGRRYRVGEFGRRRGGWRLGVDVDDRQRRVGLYVEPVAVVGDEDLVGALLLVRFDQRQRYAFGYLGRRGHFGGGDAQRIGDPMQHRGARQQVGDQARPLRHRFELRLGDVAALLFWQVDEYPARSRAAFQIPHSQRGRRQADLGDAGDRRHQRDQETDRGEGEEPAAAGDFRRRGSHALGTRGRIPSSQQRAAGRCPSLGAQMRTR